MLKKAVFILFPLLALGCYVLADWWSAYPAETVRTYVGSERCATCHQAEFDKWRGSHHDRAMQHATPQTVLGDFNDATFEHFGVTTRMFKRDGKFWMNTEGFDGKYQDYAVGFTFGVAPLQQYLVEFPDGRLQVLPYCWDTVQKRWFHVYQDEPIRPGDELHWTGHLQTWNHMCAECHSTNLQRNYDPHTNAYKTTYSEIDVGCEACHGPGSLHTELAESQSLFWDRRFGKGLSVTLKDPSNLVQTETCAQCHARSSPIHTGHTPGNAFDDHKMLHLIDGENYYDDGQIRDEVFEHGSFQQSKMFRKNIKCSDCHDPHTSKTKHPGNQLCTSCHQHPAGKYDTPAHTHHAPNSTGSACVECHMPQTTYMVVHRRRDHSIRIPRPDLSVKLGTPNACNQCHDGLATPESKDKTQQERAQWAADKIVEWYGPKRAQDPHYGETLHTARRGDRTALAELIKLCTSRDVGPIVRASAVDLLGDFVAPGSDDPARKAILAAVADSDPMVRAAAIRVLPEADLFARGAALLADPSRLVRDRATIRLSPYPRARLPRELAAALGPALEERIAGQKEILDTPAANDNLGTIELNRGDYAAAIDYFANALKIQPQFLDAAYLKAKALELAGRGGEVEPTLREAIERHDRIVASLRREIDAITVPDVRARREAYLERSKSMAAMLRFDLALKIAQYPARYAEAVEVFEDVLKLDPRYPRAAFNLGQVLRLQGNQAKAVVRLRSALEAEPGSVEILVALASALIADKKSSEAETLLNSALKSDPRPDYVLPLSEIYIERKQFDAAEKLLAYSYERFHTPEFLVALRDLYLTQKRTDEARAVEQRLRALPRSQAGAE